jgi:hypothetical protein
MQVAPAVSQPRFFHLATDWEVWEASDRLRGGSAPSGGARRELILPAVRPWFRRIHRRNPGARSGTEIPRALVVLLIAALT